jgi:3-hydroxyacyl-CoA dehydrogenase
MSERALKQLRLSHWAEDLKLGTDKRTRLLRFIEEAMELVQAGGLTREEIDCVKMMVFNRPAGELAQEIGGVMVTLYLVAERHGLDVEEEEDREIARIHTPEVMEKCRRRQAEKKALGL